MRVADVRSSEGTSEKSLGRGDSKLVVADERIHSMDREMKGRREVFPGREDKRVESSVVGGEVKHRRSQAP